MNRRRGLGLSGMRLVKRLVKRTIEKENALKEDEVGACPHNSYTFFGTFFSTFSTYASGAAIREKTTTASS
jgi:hypothetical protein